MSIYKIEVGVALQRPPRHDATIFFTLDAPSGQAAELLACQMAQTHPRVVMAVGSVVTDWEDDSA